MVMAGGWDLLGGGVEPGETLEDCLVREVMEEGCARVVESRSWAASALTVLTTRLGPGATTRTASARSSSCDGPAARDRRAPPGPA